MSTVDTHPMSALLDYEEKYPGVKNRKENLIYNTDKSFGKFWSYFKTSPYKDNTIVILTADHAHTASVLLDEVADASYKKENFDDMTFVIYAPQNNLPSEMTVYGSSLDFAPSLLNLLGINHVENSFMGRSIFGDRQQTKGAIGLIYNRKLFLVNKESYQAEKLSLNKCRKKHLKPHTKYMCSVFKVIKQSHYLQVEHKF
jgi:phosphoglycerol transferase MdoB-like AlkP superfamily enzyme